MKPEPNGYTTVREFLEFRLRAAKKLNYKDPFAEFLLTHGYQFKPGALPTKIKPGPTGMCYFNAAKYVANNGNGLVYCEGYAAGIIPVLHAWLIDMRQPTKAIDPTWTGTNKRPAMGVDYFGVPIKRHFLKAHLLRTEHWSSILDDWQHDFPILRFPVSTWKHELPL